MGLRIAKIGENPVAHVTSHEAVESIDSCLTGILVDEIHLAQIFRVQAPGQLGGADEITEHHGEMAAFRSGRPGGESSRSGGTGTRLAVAKLGDSFKELLTRAKGNAELFQILVGQLGEHFEVDLLLGENCREPAETEPVQPLRHAVHHLPPLQRRPRRRAADAC